MKLGLHEKIKAVMDKKKAYAEGMKNRYKDSVKQFNDPVISKRYTPQGFRDVVYAELNPVTEDYSAKKKEFEQEIAMVIVDARQNIEQEMNAKVKASMDYDVRFNTAFMALTKMDMSTLDDETAFMILGEFAEDNDKLRLCKKVIENENPLAFIKSDGSSRMPKTFGHLEKYLSAVNRLNEIEKMVEGLFVNEQDDPNGGLMVGGTELWHDGSMVGGTRFNIVDPVKVDTHEGAKLLELALKLDVFADEIEIVEDDQKADPSNMTYSQLLEYLETHPDAVIE